MTQQITISVKHSCGHIEFHRVTAANDGEAATIEVSLMQSPCSKCQEPQGDTLAKIVINDLQMTTKRNGA